MESRWKEGYFPYNIVMSDYKVVIGCKGDNVVWSSYKQ